MNETTNEKTNYLAGTFEGPLDLLLHLLDKDKIDIKDIYCTLGSPWVPADVIDDFIEHYDFSYFLILSGNKTYHISITFEMLVN